MITYRVYRQLPPFWKKGEWHARLEFRGYVEAQDEQDAIEMARIVALAVAPIVCEDR